jgi:hypothetical protein
VNEKSAYDELCFYTLAHARQDPAFIHQHVVDAYAASGPGVVEFASRLELRTLSS